MNLQNDSLVDQKQALSRDNSMCVEKNQRSKSKGKKKGDQSEKKEKAPWGERKVKYEPEFKYVSNSFMKYPLSGMSHAQERPIYEKIDIGDRQNYGVNQEA